MHVPIEWIYFHSTLWKNHNFVWTNFSLQSKKKNKWDMKVRKRHSRLAYKWCSRDNLFCSFLCNTLLCRFREEDIGVVFDIFLGMMKRASIFIRVICNNRSIFSLIPNIDLSCSWTLYGIGNEQLKAQLQTLF